MRSGYPDDLSSYLVVGCMRPVLEVSWYAVTTADNNFSWFHILLFWELLFRIESDFETSAEFADTEILQTLESPSKKFIGEFNSYQAEETRHADEDIYFVAVVINARNLNSEIAVDFFRAVCECCCFHFWSVFGVKSDYIEIALQI